MMSTTAGFLNMGIVLLAEFNVVLGAVFVPTLTSGFRSLSGHEHYSHIVPIPRGVHFSSARRRSPSTGRVCLCLNGVAIARQATGIEAVEVGVYPIRARIVAFRAVLGIPEHVTPFSLVSMGYAAETKPPLERYDPGRVHKNNWGRVRQPDKPGRSPLFHLRMRILRWIRGWTL